MVVLRSKEQREGSSSVVEECFEGQASQTQEPTLVQKENKKVKKSLLKEKL